MLNFLRQLFQRDAQSADSSVARADRRKSPRTSPASVLTTKPPLPLKEPDTEPGGLELSEEEPEEVVLDPSIGLEDTAEVGGDPYDTGAYRPPDVWRKTKKHSE
jgi:hypothetical protein